MASYSIGLQNGSPTGCTIRDCESYYTGADSFDLKARSDVATSPVQNEASNLLCRRYNMRLDGSAGVDVRGVWNLLNITCKEFGENAAKSYIGVRFRTKPPVTDVYNKAAAYSTIYGFNIESDNVGTVTGVQSGSDDVKICGGTVRSVADGVALIGNGVGSAERNTVSCVTVIDASEAFTNSVNVDNCNFNSCYAVDSTIGFRVEGTNIRLSSCESNGVTPLSVAASALDTLVISSDCKLGEDSQLKISQVAVGRVGVVPIGTSSNIDIELSPKGAGKLRFGELTASADAAVSGYITIKDSTGVSRKLAVIT